MAVMGRERLDWRMRAPGQKGGGGPGSLRGLGEGEAEEAVDGVDRLADEARD